MQFRILLGDITKWKADAIVNSANSTLLGVSGLDSAIHQAGGVSLTAACRGLHGCPEGDAKITYGYHLPARFVIHTVGPFWRGGKAGENTKLASCYEKSLALAKERHLHHIAFTSIATEEQRFPLVQAAAVAVSAIMDNGIGLERVDIVCVDKAAQDAYTRAAITFWLEQLNMAGDNEIADLIADAIATLVLLHTPENEPDPIMLTEGVRQMKSILESVLDKSKPQNALLDMEKAVAKIYDLYR